MKDFENKVALITGAGRGIGRAAALALAERGAAIAANDITPVNLDETVTLIVTSGGQVKEYIFDIAKRMPVLALVSQVLEDWDHIDILVNCAAVEVYAPLLELDEWDWQRSLDVNLSGPFYLMQAVGQAMLRQGSGVIVNLGASTGKNNSLEHASAFVASKTGLVGLTRAAAREFASAGIRVNLVSPGRSEIQEVVNLILYLCSDASSSITGQAIQVDGEMFMS